MHSWQHIVKATLTPPSCLEWSPAAKMLSGTVGVKPVAWSTPSQSSEMPFDEHILLEISIFTDTNIATRITRISWNNETYGATMTGTNMIC